MSQAPVMVLNTNTERETGRAAQRGNVQAAKAVAVVKKDPTGPCLKKIRQFERMVQPHLLSIQ
jgi:hypothetical protein